MNNTRAHQKLVDDILFAVGSGNMARVWKNNTGMGTDLYSKRVIKFGLPGSADILGITNMGRFLAIEVKTGSGKLSAQQQLFRDMIISFRGLYILGRDVQTVVTQIKQGLGETSCKNSLIT